MIDILIKIFWWLALPGVFCLGFVVACLLMANKHLECINCKDRKLALARQFLKEFQDE